MKKLNLIWPIVLVIIIIAVAVGVVQSNKNDYCGNEQFHRSTVGVTMDANPGCSENQLKIDNLGSEVMTLKITEIQKIDGGYEYLEVIEETDIEANSSIDYNLDGLDKSYQYEFLTPEDTEVNEYTYKFY